MTRVGEGFGGYPDAQMNVALWLARIAFRVDSREALQEALDVYARHDGIGGPERRAEAAWVRALADADETSLVAASSVLTR